MISRGDSRLCVKNDDLIMYLILDDSNAFPMLFSEHMIQECCLHHKHSLICLRSLQLGWHDRISTAMEIESELELGNAKQRAGCILEQTLPEPRKPVIIVTGTRGSCGGKESGGATPLAACSRSVALLAVVSNLTAARRGTKERGGGTSLLRVAGTTTALLLVKLKFLFAEWKRANPLLHIRTPCGKHFLTQ
jgi:hypothetical protein